MPPKNEEVLILYKDKKDALTQDNLFYGIASWVEDSNFNFERWSYFTEYQGYYEVVYWTPLVDMPRIESESYNQALEELAEFFHRDYVFDSICRDDCTQAKLVDLVDDFVKQLKK